jgi:phenylalanyl-tRNA synthetase beta subunit
MASGEHWSGGTRQVDFFDIKGVAQRVCETALVESRTEPHNERWLVPGQSAAVMANGTRIGSIGPSGARR